MTAAPRTIVGIDFSGARDAGRRIWVAETVRDDRDRLTLVRCRRAADLTGGGMAPDAAYAALRKLIAGSPDGAFGIDAPFALPNALMPEACWSDFAAGFASRHRDAEAFRAACAAQAGRELKRRTDREARTPFSAYNLRLYRQTYSAIRDVLAPLAAEGAATIVPMHRPAPGRALVFEICPASLLKARGLYVPYKGRGQALADARGAILETFVASGDLAPPAPTLHDQIVADTGGDALDAALTAIGTRNALRTPEWHLPRDALDAREGRVFF